MGVAQRAVKSFLDEEKGSTDSGDDAKSARERTLDTVFAKAMEVWALVLPYVLSITLFPSLRSQSV